MSSAVPAAQCVGPNRPSGRDAAWSLFATSCACLASPHSALIVVCDFNVPFATLIARNRNIEVFLISLHRHTLGQVAGLVHIGAAGGGGVVGQQLQGYDVEDGGERAVVFGQADEVHAFAGFDLAVGVGEDVELAAAGAHFLQVALEFVEQRVARGDGDHGHGFGHQRQRAVLEFARGVGLGVDVGDFLELEGAFEGDGVVHAAPKEQGVFAAGELLGPGDDLRLQRQHALHGGGQVTQGGEHGGFSLVAQAAFGAGQRPGQQVERNELGGEGLGRGHADFGAGAGEELHGGFARHGAGGDVDHSQGVGVAELLGVFERGQRVGGFARLGNDDDQRARVGH